MARYRNFANFDGLLCPVVIALYPECCRPSEWGV